MKKIMLMVLLASASMQMVAMDQPARKEFIEAALNDDVPRVRALLDKGVDPNIKNDQGLLMDPVIFDVIQKGNFATIALLLDRGANPNIKNSLSMTPLMQAAKYRKFDIAKLLIQRKADVNAVDFTGDTPLMWADDSKIAELLILNGANLATRNNKGNTALHQTLDRDVAFAILTEISPEEKTNIEQQITGVSAVKFAKPQLPGDVAKLINQEIINNLVEEHMQRIAKLLEINNNNGQTALEVAKSLATTNPVQAYRKAEVAQQLDLKNPAINNQIRKKVESNIRRILFTSKAGKEARERKKFDDDLDRAYQKFINERK